MFDLIVLVVISLILISNFLFDEKLDSYFLDFDYIYFQFLEDESDKLEIKNLIKKQIKLEQKIKKNNKIIKTYKNSVKPFYIKGSGYIMVYDDKPSIFDVWKAEGLNIKYKKEWQKLRLKNIELSNK